MSHHQNPPATGFFNVSTLFLNLSALFQIHFSRPSTDLRRNFARGVARNTTWSLICGLLLPSTPPSRSELCHREFPQLTLLVQYFCGPWHLLHIFSWFSRLRFFIHLFFSAFYPELDMSMNQFSVFTVHNRRLLAWLFFRSRGCWTASFRCLFRGNKL